METMRELFAMMGGIVCVCNDSINAAEQLYLNSATSFERSERLTELFALKSLATKIVAEIKKYIDDEMLNSENPIVNR
jgi:hypothetical protein